MSSTFIEGLEMMAVTVAIAIVGYAALIIWKNRKPSKDWRQTIHDEEDIWR